MLSRSNLVEYCRGMTGAYAEFPFGPEAEVFKVKEKMFALIPVDAHPPTISLKCDPVEAVIMRENYASVVPGYHLNKKHWNTVTVNGEIDDRRILEMIEDSYILVRGKLAKAKRLELGEMESDD